MGNAEFAQFSKIEGTGEQQSCNVVEKKELMHVG